MGTVSGDLRDPDFGHFFSVCMGRGDDWSLGLFLQLQTHCPPLLPLPRSQFSCLPGEWRKAERPRAGGEANLLVTPQQGLGARSASVIHQHDCPLPACVGLECQHILPVPTEKDLVGGEGTESTQSKKKTQRKKRAGPLCPGT